MPYSPVIKVYYSRGSIQSSASEDPTNSFGPGLTDPSTCCSITTADGCNINTVTKFGLTNDHRLLPAPMISIQPEIYYANETPIGYTYNITLDGYATSVDLNQGIIPTGVNDSFNKTLGSIQKVKNIFSFNNGILTVLEASHDPAVKDKIILRASGCIIRNLNFEENENNWVNYSKYKVNLEANEINFVSCSGTGETFGCKSGQPPALPSGIINADSPNLLDMKKYKIKSFRDGWTINLTNNIYNSYIISGVNNQYHFNNDYIDIEYTVTANGKHYTNFKSDNEIYVTPAWEQAKNFCQNRVYKVVDRLIQDLLVVNNINEAQELFGSRSGNYDSIFYSPTGVGVADSFNNNISATSGNSFGVYNEKITCETSESDGSFTATYKAIVKKKNTLSNDKIYSNTITTITHSKQIKDDGKDRDISITVNGSIQGLIEGGLIKSSGTLYLPASGKLFKNTTYSEPPTFPSGKYDSALIGYNNIAGSSGLAEDLAQALSITYSGLGISGCYLLPLSGIPLAANHSVTHDYSAGTINFTTVYNNKKACQGNGLGNRITNSTIVIDEPLPRIAQFVVPGKKSGPIIQRIGTDTPRYITVTVEGVDHNAGCVSPKSVIENICAHGIVLTENSGYPLKLYYDDFAKKGMKLLDNKYTYNRTDGSYSIVRRYLSYNYLENPVNDDGTFVMGGDNPGRFNLNDYEEVGKP